MPQGMAVVLRCNGVPCENVLEVPAVAAASQEFAGAEYRHEDNVNEVCLCIR